MSKPAASSASAHNASVKITHPTTAEQPPAEKQKQEKD